MRIIHNWRKINYFYFKVYDDRGPGNINGVLAKMLNQNCPNLITINVGDDYKLLNPYDNLFSSIQNVKSLKKLTFFKLNSDGIGEDIKETSTLKVLKFLRCALIANDVLNIARKCYNLEELYIEGKTTMGTVKNFGDYDYNNPVPYLFIELESVKEILNEISANGAMKNLQILNVCLIRSANENESEISIDDIEKFAKTNFVPIIESKFQTDCYIKIIFLEPNHPKLEEQEDSVESESLVMLERKVNQKPKVFVQPYPYEWA